MAHVVHITRENDVMSTFLGDRGFHTNTEVSTSMVPDQTNHFIKCILNRQQALYCATDEEDGGRSDLRESTEHRILIGLLNASIFCAL